MFTRSAGVLLHPTSLPSGRIDGDARRFVDLIAGAGFSWWQVLPLSPPGADGSPYAARSAFAGHAGLLPDGHALAASHEGHSFEVFRDEAASWLGDWAEYAALKERFGGAPWWKWPAPLRDRDSHALGAFRGEAWTRITEHAIAQWRFDREWAALREHAAGRGVRIIGDVPIWVALDSAEVWANRHLFKLRADGTPGVVSGVPPDLFSATGQRWGNPIYDWDAMRADGFAWWVDRVRWALRHADALRIDHFRGFAACWEIPFESEGALEGEWVDVPGHEIFEAIRGAVGALPFVAEDLGLITPDVIALRDRLGLPGMAILQYAFDGERDNPYIPHNLSRRQVVYTGTHDNQTTLGWLGSLDTDTRARLDAYAARPGAGLDDVLRLALASVSDLAMLPMQDILGLGDDGRMNTPASHAGNWQWRFQWSQVDAVRMAMLGRMVDTYGRRP